ncbi:c-type cytochrome [Rhodobacteraceae bacterium KMM 6894]|nr:c-type cytochrome [Rhodobacteraceae bacterium KMM 6894]
MSKFLKIAVALSVLGTAAQAEPLGLGREALPEEIAAWDIAVRPDGRGLPPGSGNVLDGEEIFADKCAACHGDFAEGIDNWPKLAGGWDTLDREDPVKTVGSYWPYLSTTWDYINRSMPFGAAQTLTPDEVYAITAYILYSNDLVDDDFELSDQNLADFEMPNADGFIIDDRAETEYGQFSTEPCMSDCKDEVKVTMRAMVLDVTPDVEGAEGETEAVMEEAAAIPEAPAVEEVAAIDPELVKAGEKVFRKCKACHQVGEGAKNRVGPVLTGIVGHPAGQVDGFKYSKALKGMADDGLVWDPEALHAFLANPKGFMKGTKMSFAGLKKEEDLAAITAYLSSFNE